MGKVSATLEPLLLFARVGATLGPAPRAPGNLPASTARIGGRENARRHSAPTHTHTPAPGGTPVGDAPIGLHPLGYAHHGGVAARRTELFARVLACTSVIKVSGPAVLASHSGFKHKVGGGGEQGKEEAGGRRGRPGGAWRMGRESGACKTRQTHRWRSTHGT